MTDYSHEYVKHQERVSDSYINKSLPLILGLATLGMLVGILFLDEPWELLTGVIFGVNGGVISIFLRK